MSSSPRGEFGVALLARGSQFFILIMCVRCHITTRRTDSVLNVNYFGLNNGDVVKQSVYWFDQYAFDLRIYYSHQDILDCIGVLGAIILNT